jgi:hypothetical protein
MSELPPVNIPRVARAPSRTRIAPFAVGLGVIGTAVFASLANHRSARDEQATALPPLRTTTITAPAPPPPAIVATQTAIVPIPIQSTLPPPVLSVPLQPQRVYGTVPVVRPPRSDNGAAERARARIAAPALIVDLPPARSSGEGLRPSPASLEDFGRPLAASLIHTASFQDPTAAAIAAAGPGVTGDAVTPLIPVVSVDPTARDLNPNERFSSQVLIPAGSHVIGEYNSGVAQGASRIFIVWNRLIRPDGVSVSLGSPAVDDLGRGGLGGKVNRHFLQRFGGAILLSVLTGGISAVTQSLSRGSTVVVSNSNEATSLAGQASRGGDIAPTIKTLQGATVRIFVARDLDFSAVGPTI